MRVLLVEDDSALAQALCGYLRAKAYTVDAVTTIAAAVEEQSVTTRDIAENVGQASTGITEINSNVAASSAMTRNVSKDIEQVRAASDEMTASSQTVQSSARELSELAERLREQVSRFRI